LLVVDPPEACDQARPVLLPVLLEPRAIEDPRQNSPRVEGLLEVGRDDVVELLCIVERFLQSTEIEVDFGAIELFKEIPTFKAMLRAIQSACS
jgi:hypothetical protein